SQSSSSGSPQPRYRPPLSFGHVLDEGVRLYRAHLTTFVLGSAIGLLPSGLILVAAGAAGLLSSGLTPADLRARARPGDPAALGFGAGARLGTPAALEAFNAQLQQQLAALFVTGLISAVFGLIWTSAVVTTTDTYIHDRQPSIGAVFVRALRRSPVVVLSTI